MKVPCYEIGQTITAQLFAAEAVVISNINSTAFIMTVKNFFTKRLLYGHCFNLLPKKFDGMHTSSHYILTFGCGLWIWLSVCLWPTLYVNTIFKAEEGTVSRRPSYNFQTNDVNFSGSPRLNFLSELFYELCWYNFQTLPIVYLPLIHGCLGRQSRGVTLREIAQWGFIAQNERLPLSLRK